MTTNKRDTAVTMSEGSFLTYGGNEVKISCASYGMVAGKHQVTSWLGVHAGGACDSWHPDGQWNLSTIPHPLDIIRRLPENEVPSGQVDETPKTLAEFQKRTGVWLTDCFPERIVKTRGERSFRFLEESLELVQSLELSKQDAIRVVDYVYNRDVGESAQEVGGTMVTLAALCWNEAINIEDAAFDELKRIERPEIMDKIRAKQDAKSAVGMGMATDAPISPKAPQTFPASNGEEYQTLEVEPPHWTDLHCTGEFVEEGRVYRWHEEDRKMFKNSAPDTWLPIRISWLPVRWKLAPSAPSPSPEKQEERSFTFSDTEGHFIKLTEGTLPRLNFQIDALVQWRDSVLSNLPETGE